MTFAARSLALLLLPLAAACTPQVVVSSDPPGAGPDARLFRHVAASAAATCAVRVEGSVTCWGEPFGDLPMDMPGVEGAIQVSLGLMSACALHDDGRVSCWATGHEKTHGTPEGVAGIEDAIGLAVGDHHACALRAGGAVACWGNNAYGQLGDGTFADRAAPAPVIGLAGVVQISAGSVHTCARLDDGSARCWGVGTQGELGDGLTQHMGCGLNDGCSPIAVKVAGVHDAVDLSCGTSNAAVRRADGSVLAWGWNSMGEVGDGSQVNRFAPVSVSGLDDALGLHGGYLRACALRAGGALVCWGAPVTAEEWSPIVKPTGLGIGDAVEVADGWYHACVLDSRGVISCWGDNQWHQLGDGASSARTEPAAIVAP